MLDGHVPDALGHGHLVLPGVSRQIRERTHVRYDLALALVVAMQIGDGTDKLIQLLVLLMDPPIEAASQSPQFVQLLADHDGL